MNEVNRVLMADIFTIIKSLSEHDRERLADIGRGILLASGGMDGTRS